VLQVHQGAYFSFCWMLKEAMIQICYHTLCSPGQLLASSRFPDLALLLLSSCYISTWRKNQDIIVLGAVNKNKKENNPYSHLSTRGGNKYNKAQGQAVSLELW